VAELLLVDHAEGREQPASGQALIVQRAEPGVGVAVLGSDRLVVADALERVDAAGVAAEVVVQAARLGHGIERGVAHRPADATAHHVVAPAVNGRPLHAAGREGRVQVAGERVLGFVVVVVRVDDRVAEGVSVHRPRVEHVLARPPVELPAADGWWAG
jgi:hypothetical protein